MAQRQFSFQPGHWSPLLIKITGSQHIQTQKKHRSFILPCGAYLLTRCFLRLGNNHFPDNADSILSYFTLLHFTVCIWPFFQLASYILINACIHQLFLVYLASYPFYFPNKFPVTFRLVSPCVEKISFSLILSFLAIR
jgi:hypothetical protein